MGVNNQMKQARQDAQNFASTAFQKPGTSLEQGKWNYDQAAGWAGSGTNSGTMIGRLAMNQAAQKAGAMPTTQRKK